jgi:hypothetical protein
VSVCLTRPQPQLGDFGDCGIERGASVQSARPMLSCVGATLKVGSARSLVTPCAVCEVHTVRTVARTCCARFCPRPADP